MTAGYTFEHHYDRIEHRKDGRLLCCVCAQTTRLGDDGPRHIPAVWVWHHQNGNVSHLCDPCFVWWCKFAAEDVDDKAMTPAKYYRVQSTVIGEGYRW